MSKRLYLLAVPLALSQMGATDCGQIISDPGFDLWCGDRLCDWKVEQGTANRVPTWHSGDDGVDLVGDDVLITQQTPVTSNDSTCIEFSMLTNVDLDADVHLQFDVFGDGTVDYDQPIPAAPWTPVSYLVKFAAPWNGIQFRIAKHGGGHAVLAEIKAETHDANDCPNDAIVLPPRPDGAWCTAPTDCASSSCARGLCGTCSSDTDCPTGMACGTDEAVPWWLSPYPSCLATASRALGELCAEDAECASGVCNQTCSTCRADADCASGESCKAADQAFPTSTPGADYYSTPTFECSPGAGLRAHGEPCFRDGDCTSGTCAGQGALDICLDLFGGGDGRVCATDLDCPEGGDLQHTTCGETGILSGTCQ